MVAEPGGPGERIRKFIAAQTGCPLAKIALHSRIEEDLRVTGDDHVELLDAFFEEFRVKPGDFSYARYCSAEGLAIPGFGRKDSPAREPLTVAMLAEAATSGVWESARLAGKA